MKKILIITYYWPPAGGAGVQRWLKFVKYLAGNKQFDITVYTVENPESPEDDNSLLHDIPERVKVIKKRIWEPLGIYKKVTGQKRLSAGFLDEGDGKKNGLLKKLSVYIRGNFFIPDAKMFWIKPSVKYLNNYIKEHNIDTLITTGPPHSVNVIGLKLKHKNKNINWITDFRDPWTNIDFYKELNLTKLADSKHKRLEKRVLAKADNVITVGYTLGEELKQISGKENVTVITNGYDSTDFNLYEETSSDKFTIAHIGSINKDRNHESFYKSVKEFVKKTGKTSSELALLFVGKVDNSVLESIKKYELTEYCEFVKYMPHNEAIKFMQKANVLYLPINNTPNAKGILTGKFFEYLACKTPILVIGPADGDVAKILKDTNSGEIFDFYDSKGIANFLLHFNRKQYTFAGVEKYSRKQLTQQLIKILNEV